MDKQIFEVELNIPTLFVITFFKHKIHGKQLFMSQFTRKVDVRIFFSLSLARVLLAMLYDSTISTKNGVENEIEGEV